MFLFIRQLFITSATVAVFTPRPLLALGRTRPFSSGFFVLGAELRPGILLSFVALSGEMPWLAAFVAVLTAPIKIYSTEFGFFSLHDHASPVQLISVEGINDLSNLFWVLNFHESVRVLSTNTFSYFYRNNITFLSEQFFYFGCEGIYGILDAELGNVEHAINAFRGGCLSVRRVAFG